SRSAPRAHKGRLDQSVHKVLKGRRVRPDLRVHKDRRGLKDLKVRRARKVPRGSLRCHLPDVRRFPMAQCLAFSMMTTPSLVQADFLLRETSDCLLAAGRPASLDISSLARNLEELA